MAESNLAGLGGVDGNFIEYLESDRPTRQACGLR
jgi:hypothetical protein